MLGLCVAFLKSGAFLLFFSFLFSVNEIISMRIEPSQLTGLLSDCCRSSLDLAESIAVHLSAIVDDRQRLCRMKGEVQITKTLVERCDTHRPVAAKGMFPK